MNSKPINNKLLNTQTKNRFSWSRIFGYDFFISFKLGSPPVGAQSYASDLARRLREHDYTVFYSEEDAPPGVKLSDTLLTALLHSSILVVIANEGALLQSQWVRKEVEEFRHRRPKRPIILINVDHAVQKFGSIVEASTWLDNDGRIWLDETAQAIVDGIPSLTVIERLKLVPWFFRSNRLRRWTVVTVILTLTILAFWAKYEESDATRKFWNATGFKLAAQAEPILAGTPSRGDILAYLKLAASDRLSNEAEIKATLLRALDTKAEEHWIAETPLNVDAIEYSPDGNRIITGSGDNILHLWDAKNGKPIGSPLKGHQGKINKFTFSRDSTRIVSVSADTTLRLWDAKTGQPIGLPLRGHSGSVTSVAISPNGTRIVSGSTDKTLRLWNAQTGQAVGEALQGHGAPITGVAFSPDGTRIVSGSEDGTLRFWDAVSGQTIDKPDFSKQQTSIGKVVYSPDGTHIVSQSSTALRLWDSKTGKLDKTLQGHKDYITDFSFSEDGSRIVSCSADTTLRLWNARTGKPIEPPLQGHIDTVTSVAFIPKANIIVSSSFDKTLRFWDVKDGSSKGIIDFNEWILRVVAIPDGTGVVFSSSDQTLRSWNLKGGQPLGQLVGTHAGSVLSVAFSPCGTLIVSGSADTTLRLWDAKTGDAIGQPLRGHTGSVTSVAFSPDGTRIVSGSADTTLRLWDAKTGEAIGQPLLGHENEVISVAFSPDSTKIISGSTDDTIRIWDAKTNQQIGRPLKLDGEITSVVLSPTGARIAFGSLEWFWLLDLKKGQPIGLPFQGHRNAIVGVAFNPNSTRIVSASEDQTLLIWDTKTSQPSGPPLVGHSGPVNTARFSPDGSIIVSGSNDHTLRFWDSKTGKPIGPPLNGHQDKVLSVAFSPNGTRIVSGSADGTLRLWPAPMSLVNEICKKVGRNMSLQEWREWVSPDIDYFKQCPGLPVPQNRQESKSINVNEEFQ